MNEMANNNAISIGFLDERGGAHLARTLMLEELQLLLAYVDNPNTDRSEYFEAIKQE